MSQLLKYVLSVTVFAVVMVQWLRGDDPRRPAGLTDALPSGAVSRFGTSRFLNYGRVFSVAFSLDGKILAAGSWDGAVRLWEVGTGKELHRFGEQQTPVRS